MNQLVRKVKPSYSREKRITVSRVNRISANSSLASYRYEFGGINWSNQRMVAIVIGALPDQIGCFADKVLDALVTEILVMNPILSAEVGTLQVFVHTPPGLHVAPWRSFRLRVDGNRVIMGSAEAVPSKITQQLEIIFAQ
jgi:hypothetical protein